MILISNNDTSVQSQPHGSMGSRNEGGCRRTLQRYDYTYEKQDANCRLYDSQLRGCDKYKPWADQVNQHYTVRHYNPNDGSLTDYNSMWMLCFAC